MGPAPLEPLPWFVRAVACTVVAIAVLLGAAVVVQAFQPCAFAGLAGVNGYRCEERLEEQRGD